MREVGKVIAVKGNFATVSVQKRDECSKCGLCLFPKNASTVEFNAQNSLNAKVEDVVVIETVERTKFLGIVLAFLVPLVLIGAMVLVSFAFPNAEIWIVIASVILITLWYTILVFIDKVLAKNKKFATTIVEIIKEKKENE